METNTENRRVWIRFEEELGVWRIYWSGTFDLADDREFETLGAAGRVARQILGLEQPPKLSLVESPKEVS